LKLFILTSGSHLLNPVVCGENTFCLFTALVNHPKQLDETFLIL